MSVPTIKIAEYYHGLMRSNAPNEAVVGARALLEQSLSYTQTHIYKYVMLHPGCISRDIASRFDISVHQVANELNKLRQYGLVDSKKRRTAYGHENAWSATL